MDIVLAATIFLLIPSSVASKDVIIAKIQERRARLDRLESMLADATAEELSFLREILTEPTPTISREIVQAAHATAPAAPVCFGQPPTVKRGDQDQEVRRAVAAIKTGITVHNVVEEMIRSGFKFAAKSPTVAVGTVLRRLKEAGLIVEVAVASGRTPARYQLAKQEGDATSA